MKRISMIVTVALAATPAAAMVGDAPPAASNLARHVVLLIGSKGTSCSGVLIARDLVLTAAHCALPGADYRLVEFDAAKTPRLREIARIERHPQFDLKTMLAHRASADVALIKLAAPLGAPFAPAPLAVPAKPVAAGDRFTVAGNGVAIRGDGKTGGTVRAAELIATGRPGSLQIRLVDPAGRGEVAGLGACTGDSGAPAFSTGAAAPAVIGVVSWSTGPKLSDGCGGMTGITPLARYKDWIVKTAAAMGSPLR